MSILSPGLRRRETSRAALALLASSISTICGFSATVAAIGYANSIWKAIVPAVVASLLATLLSWILVIWAYNAAFLDELSMWPIP